nr:hypothetical protein [Candidatus Paceibacterota bacterium]
MKKNLGYFLSTLLLALILSPLARAQEPVAAPTGLPAQSDPSDADKAQIEGEANSRAESETAAARAQFENDFGAPPEAFAKHGPKELPKYEEPKGIPESVRQYVTDAEIVPIYCATVKWKTGEFFTSMNALKNNMLPAMQKVKSDLGISMDAPDIDGIISEGQSRVDAICSAKTIDDADKLARDFQTWGLDPNRVPIESFMQEFAKKMQEKGDELRKQIEAAIQPTINEETPKIQAEIEAEAKSMAGSFKFTKQPSAADIANMRAQIEERLKPIIEQKKEQVKQKVMAKIEEIKNGEAGKFQEYGKLFEGTEQKIETERKAGLSAYEKYKEEAFRLRKEVVFNILDKNLAEGMKQLDAAEKDIEEAGKSDPSIRSVAEIKADIEADKKVLSSKLDAALEAGDDGAFESALTDFRTKWEQVRKEGESLAKQSASKACNMALPQFENAKSQMDGNMSKITSLEAKCAGSTSEECLTINEFSGRFATLKSKINDIKSAM